MSERFARTQLLLGKDKMERLAQARVAIFGVGGVGGYVAEALARSGIGSFLLVDNDCVSLSNINRQIIALTSTVGRLKTEVMRERILEINPDAQVEIRNCFFLPENAGEFDLTKYSYVVDAVDTVTAKLQLICQAQESNVPVISSMGAGNKLDPSLFRITDIYKTDVCPLAKVMRRELKKRGVIHLKVVYSPEKPIRPAWEEQSGLERKKMDAGEKDSSEEKGEAKGEAKAGRRAVPGSISFVPSVAGLLLAGEVVRDLAGME